MHLLAPGRALWTGDWFVQMFVVSQKKRLCCPFVVATGVYLFHQVTVGWLTVIQISSMNNNNVVKYTTYPTFCHKAIKCFRSQVS